ncbi:cell envelope biogenesis protein TolA [Sphingomonas immobilis]|uniref:Cell envelope biogenesis protein TolA n=1 Tax=Sphingomonas immobilis TaxID=3063997 RepID=A0ABT9A297_9SPHN|nr:cell envelope biogenesis protein TolA [Sphingomonas sp. CA1-15]MDO7843954.1 cell envelope biogenesis protein TolA [Sphingomonas sp. CA1-15]
MQRAEKIGIGVALAAHVGLFWLLSLGRTPPPDPKLYAPKPIEVSLAKDVALEQSAPKAPEPPSQSAGPEQGPPEESPPPAPQPKPEPAPEPKPEPKPAPPKPVAKPVPKPEAVPPPKPKPAPKKPEPPKKPAPAKPADAKPTKAPAKPAQAKSSNLDSVIKGIGSSPAAKPGKKPNAQNLADLVSDGKSASPSKSKPNAAAPGATMTARAAADIGSAIKRQVQPCADRQVKPGPGAERIRVTIRLQLNPDGSLKARPAITGHTGVDDENDRYVDAVDRAAIAAFSGCAPLRDLPSELYSVPNGWSTFSLRYNLPG